MEQFIANLASTYFREHPDDFGENAVFERFVLAEGALNVKNIYPVAVFGYVAYQLGDEVRLSNRLRIHYVVCDAAVTPSPATRWFASEATFYGQTWPTVRSTTEQTLQLVPKFCASTAYWRPTGFVGAIMFEHSRGYLTWGYSRCLDEDHLSLMARKIGQFHGCVLRYQANRGELLIRERSGVSEVYSVDNCRMLASTLSRCLHPLYNDPLYNVDPTFAPGLERLAAKVNHLDKSVAAANQAPKRCNVLCHMNCSQASVFFKYEGTDVVDAMIGNWSTADHCSLGADLVILLFVECDATASHDVRRRLIGVYYEALRQICPESCLPPVREVMLEIKRSVPIALFALAARVERLNLAPRLSLRTDMSTHWNDEFVTNVFRDLIVNRYVSS